MLGASVILVLGLLIYGGILFLFVLLVMALLKYLRTKNYPHHRRSGTHRPEASCRCRARRAVHGKHRCEDCKCRNGYSRHDGGKIRPARLHARCTVPRHKRCSRCVVQKHRSAYEHEKHLFCAPRTGRPHKKAEFSRRTFRPNSRNACKRQTRRTVAACFAMKCAAKGS